MSQIRDKRDIINGKALSGHLDDLMGWSGYSAKSRGQVLEKFKAALNTGRAEIRRRFEVDRASGTEVVHANAYLVDQLVGIIHYFTVQYVYPAANPTTGEQLSLAATGGFGRGEMAPYSDIDLMFLLPYKRTPHTEQLAEYMLYMLWDLGLKVGHATRSVDECIRLAGEDMTIRTSLLEARWLWGDKKLFSLFKHRFASEIVSTTGPDFVEAKLAERDARHDRMGDTRYVLEPNIKEGKGGLRDLQTLSWIAKYLYQVEAVDELVELGVLTAADTRQFAKAQNFLWTVRCHLHYLAGRPEERLGFDIQGAIGARMNYTDRPGLRGVERFMKHYFLVAKGVGDLTRILCAVLEEQQKKRRSRFRFPSLSFRRRNIEGFRIDGGRLTVENDDDFKRHPLKLIGLFREAQRNGLDIHPQALRLVTQNLSQIDERLRADEGANRLFMEILTAGEDPETALKRLNESGVFGRFLPDFGRIVAQMQYDMYHVYTVDEHTIRAIGNLHRIESGQLKDELPVASSVFGEIQSRRALYLAVLLHDIAKGRGGGHSEIGAGIASKLGPRMGLNDWETETVSWLVRHHLLMGHTAFKRDLDDPKTLSDFVQTVQSPERLRMLLILTEADIRAVGPGVWNGWKAGLLRELYYAAQEEMSGDLPAMVRTSRVEAAKAALRARLGDWRPEEVEEHIARGYPDYWLSFDVDTHVHHALLVRKAESEELNLHIETRVDKARDATEIIIYTPDHPGLFSRVAGAMALSGASTVDAKIVTLANGMVLDTFLIQDFAGGPFDNPRMLKKMWKRIEEALSGKLLTAKELDLTRNQALPSRTRVFKVPPRVLIDNQASTNHTVIEVNGRDRLGFLHDVTHVLTKFGLQIASAHISTYGERVVDVFYVKDVFGLKVEHEEKLNDIRERLLKAVAPGNGGDAAGTDNMAAAE